MKNLKSLKRMKLFKSSNLWISLELRDTNSKYKGFKMYFQKIDQKKKSIWNILKKIKI